MIQFELEGEVYPNNMVNIERKMKCEDCGLRIGGMKMGNFAIMDDKGIIDDGFNDVEECIDYIPIIREENDDIKGDLKIIEIHHIDN